MGFIASNNSARSGSAPGSAVFTFTTTAESIAEGDFVTLDTGTGTVQRANDYSIDQFGSNPPVAAAAVAVTAWNPAGCFLVLTNTDGSLLYAEGASHNALSATTSQLIKVSADGATVLKQIKLLALSGMPTLIPLSGNRLAVVQYLSATSITTSIYDTNTLELLSTTPTAFTVSSAPFTVYGDGIETANGQIVLYWLNSNVKYYAVLNADLSVKVQPTNNGTVVISSLTVIQRMRLSNGGVLLVSRHSTSLAEIVSFDASGNYRNTYSLGAGSGGFDSSQTGGRNNVEQFNSRSMRYVCETGVDKVSFIMLKNAVYSFCILDIATNTLLVDSPLGDTNHVTTWCIKDGYAYVLSMYSSTMTLKYAVFNLATNTVVKALTTLIATVAGSFTLTIQVGFLSGGDWWLLGQDAPNGQVGKVFWWTFAIGNGTIAVKIPRTLTTDNGPIQDVVIANGEALYIAGGVALNATDIPVVFGRVDLKYGTSRAGAVIRTHTNVVTPMLMGLYNCLESKVLFRPSVEKAMLLGYGVAIAHNLLQQCYLKVNTSIVLGVASSDAIGTEVDVVLSGWTNVSERYNRFQKTIDHASLNGNKVKNYGAAAYLTGSF